MQRASIKRDPGGVECLGTTNNKQEVAGKGRMCPGRYALAIDAAGITDHWQCSVPQSNATPQGSNVWEERTTNEQERG
jgi:hypothetical protein